MKQFLKPLCKLSTVFRFYSTKPKFASRDKFQKLLTDTEFTLEEWEREQQHIHQYSTKIEKNIYSNIKVQLHPFEIDCFKQGLVYCISGFPVTSTRMTVKTYLASVGIPLQQNISTDNFQQEKDSIDFGKKEVDFAFSDQEEHKGRRLLEKELEPTSDTIQFLPSRRIIPIVDHTVHHTGSFFVLFNEKEEIEILKKEHIINQDKINRMMEKQRVTYYCMELMRARIDNYWRNLVNLSRGGLLRYESFANSSLLLEIKFSEMILQSKELEANGKYGREKMTALLKQKLANFDIQFVYKVSKTSYVLYFTSPESKWRAFRYFELGASLMRGNIDIIDCSFYFIK